MKKLILGLSLSALIATPALACPDHASGDTVKTAEKDKAKSDDQATAKEQPKKQDKAKSDDAKTAKPTEKPADGKKTDKVSQK